MNLPPAFTSLAETIFTLALIVKSPYCRCTGTTSPTFNFPLWVNDTPPLEMSEIETTLSLDSNEIGF